MTLKDEYYYRFKEKEKQLLITKHNFKRYANYYLPEEIVSSAKNILSFGIHNDTKFEDRLLIDNNKLSLHMYDPTPTSVEYVKTKNYSNNVSFYPVAYAKEKGQMNFYFDENHPELCFSLIPLWGDKSKHITVETTNLVNIKKENNIDYDIIKADIEGVWYDFCTEVLDNNIKFKALLVECEMRLLDPDKSLNQYVEILTRFKEKNFKTYLNRDRDKNISEILILK
jgi:FkbM family methyltransferase